MLFNDGDFRYYLHPVGSRWIQLAVSIALGVLPLITAIAGVIMYVQAFYDVKVNKIGLREKRGFPPIIGPIIVSRSSLPVLRIIIPSVPGLQLEHQPLERLFCRIRLLQDQMAHPWRE